jgi:UDP-N-acetylmuramoyl-L-alanyl-D-glutamate--2,6-diaminopimelate ligase
MNFYTLQQLAEAIPGATIRGSATIAPTGLNYDSRLVTSGDLFVAIPGERFDGHDFIAGAIATGASSVVIEANHASNFTSLSIPQIIVPHVRSALAPLSCRFYDSPTRELYLSCVTGTNGKTTTTLMIDSVNRAAGDITGAIGTLGATIAGKSLPHDRTTPEAPDLQRLFREMRQVGATSATIEVASHALVIGRTEGCLFDVGVFTNLTQDHLDFHITMEAYRDAKGKLFREYADAARAAGKKFTAVLNIGDDAGKHYYNQSSASSLLTYSLEGIADITPENIIKAVDSVSFIAKTPQGDIPVKLGFGGTFNIANALAAVGYGVARGLSSQVIATGLAKCSPVPGRFQPVQSGQEFAVLVDYAHTPDGIENVLQSARPLTPGKLIIVFGCGGNRDRTKRPKMGKIAQELADIAVVTSDNPRHEEPEEIIDEILSGMKGDGAEVWRESDRRAAIALAVGQANRGDTVVIAGKGHEDYQILGDTTIHFSDVEVADEEIRKCFGQ